MFSNHTITKRQSAYLLISFLAIFSTLYNSFLPLHGDEAYYWVWSRHLQWGYYDHPPMVAYLIWLSGLISDSEWGVRLVSVFSMSVAALYLYHTARMIFNEQVAFLSIAIFSSALMVHAGFTITTPDAPLILFWSMGLYYSYRALFTPTTADFIMTGVAMGLLMLSKYTAILFPVSLLIFIGLKRRELFRDWRFYASILSAVIVISPMLFWNYQHEWISFAFQLKHGSAADHSLRMGHFFEFVGGQFIIFSPLFTAILFYSLFKERTFYTNERFVFLVLNLLVVLLFFFYKDLFKKMELNYTAPAYIAGSILTAWVIEQYRLRKTMIAAVIIAVSLILIVRIGMLFYLDVFQERMYGNKEAVARVASLCKPGDAFYADHLKMAALLHYYLPNHPDTQVLTRSRYSQYDMWRGDQKPQNGIYLSSHDMDSQLHTLYRSVTSLDRYTLKTRTGKIKTFYIYRVENPR